MDQMSDECTVYNGTPWKQVQIKSLWEINSLPQGAAGNQFFLSEQNEMLILNNEINNLWKN